MQFIFQKKSLILSILFFLVSCMVFVFLYRDINETKHNLQIMQEQLQTEILQKENAESITKSIKTIEKEKVMLESHFIKSSDIVPFLDTVEKLAKDVGVKAEVASVDLGEGSSFLVVEMKTLGSFQAIYKLITLLENSQYETEFIAVNIQRAEEDLSNKNPQWNAILKIKLLSFVK